MVSTGPLPCLLAEGIGQQKGHGRKAQGYQQGHPQSQVDQAPYPVEEGRRGVAKWGLELPSRYPLDQMGYGVGKECSGKEVAQIPVPFHGSSPFLISSRAFSTASWGVAAGTIELSSLPFRASSQVPRPTTGMWF